MKSFPLFIRDQFVDWSTLALEAGVHWPVLALVSCDILAAPKYVLDF